MKDKLLIVSYSFPPDNVPAAQRPYFMAKYLTENKLIRNVVLTSGNALSSLGKSEWASLSNLEVKYTGLKKTATSNTVQLKERPNSFKYFILNTLKKVLSKVLTEFLIPDRGIIWFLPGLKLGKEILAADPEIKYIYSTSPSFINHFIAYCLAKKYNLKWIADIRDFYFIHERKEHNFLFRKFFDKKIEPSVLRRADHITFVSKAMMEEYQKAYNFIKEKSSVLYNGFDPEEFSFNSSDLNSPKLKIFYAGSFYNGERNPVPMLLALEHLLQTKQIPSNRIEICMAGGEIPDMQLSQIKNLEIFQCIKHIGKVSRKQALQQMETSHLLWMIVGNKKSHSLGFPVKGYEYLGAKRHILLSAPEGSEAENIFIELSCSTWINNKIDKEIVKSNSEKLFNLFQSFSTGNLDKPLEFKPEIIRQFYRKEQATKLNNLIHSL